MTDLSILMYSTDGKVGPVHESIKNSVGDFTYKFLTTGPIRPGFKCSDWYESFSKPVPSLQKLLYKVDSEFVTIITDDAVYEPSALSRLLSLEQIRTEEGVTVVRGSEDHTFLPLSRVGYLTEIGAFDAEHPTIIDACNDFITRVFDDQRRVTVSSSRDVTFRRDHMKSRNVEINPSAIVINLDNWKYV